MYVSICYTILMVLSVASLKVRLIVSTGIERQVFSLMNNHTPSYFMPRIV